MGDDMDDINLYSLTMKTALICAPADMPVSEVVRNANQKYRTDNDRKFIIANGVLKDIDENGKLTKCSQHQPPRRHWCLEFE
jgi:hypothetical protein